MARKKTSVKNVTRKTKSAKPARKPAARTKATSPKRKPARKNATTGARRPTAKKPVARKKAVARKKPAAPKTTKPRAKAVPKVTRKASPKKMSSHNKKELRDALFALRERLVAQITSLKNASLRRSDSVYSMEDGTDAFDRQFGLSLVNSENEALYAVDEALRSLENGSYGVCDECSGVIEKPRLKALPFVRTCISCQSEIEKKRTSIVPMLSPV